MPASNDRSSRPPRIGIAGYYGCGNLGDDTVVAILINTIKEYYPNADLVGLSLSPADTERRHGIKAFHLRNQDETRSLSKSAVSRRFDVQRRLLGTFKQLLKKWRLGFKVLKMLKYCFSDLPRAVLGEVLFLHRCHRRLQGCDFLIIPGSGPLTDWWGGPWTHPYTFLSLGLLARINGAKLIALSVGSERLKTWLGKTLCKQFLSLAFYRSFRDEYSRDIMEQLGLEGHNPVCPDQGFALLDALPVPASIGVHERKPNADVVVGVIPVGKSVCVSEGADDAWYDRYIGNLSAFLSFLIRKGRYRIAFCPTTAGQDIPFVERIAHNIDAACPDMQLAGRIIKEPIGTLEEFISRIQSCDIIVASRFHGVVLPFALGKPVLAISYGRKTCDLMREFGQADYHCWMDKASAAEMIGMFEALEQNRESIAQQLGNVVSQYRVRLKEQYDEVFVRSADRCRGHDKKVSHIGNTPGARLLNVPPLRSRTATGLDKRIRVKYASVEVQQVREPGIPTRSTA